MNPAESTFWEKVVPREDGCWDWKPRHRDRSGRARYRAMDAARWSYEFFVGEIPKGMQYVHTCLKKDCVNYNHIVLKAHKDNVNLEGGNSEVPIPLRGAGT